jgi:hypothetical protein
MVTNSKLPGLAHEQICIRSPTMQDPTLAIGFDTIQLVMR